jgi:hypothetical protein
MTRTASLPMRSSRFLISSMARDAASVSEANAQRTYFNVAQLALQLGNPLLELENQNTLAEAILQENLLINNIYDRLEGGIYAAI